MTKKQDYPHFDREAYLKQVEQIKELKDHTDRHKQFNDLNDKIPNTHRVKTILLASLIIGLSLFVLVGSIMLVPIFLVGAVGYGIFVWCKSSFN